MNKKSQQKIFYAQYFVSSIIHFYINDSYMKKILISFVALFVSFLTQAQLKIYSDYNTGGTSGTCVVRTIYTNSTIPNGLNDGIKSIVLSQGFMATLAENADGSGERFTYMANKSNINVNLAMVLQNKVSFIRVLRLPTIAIKKKGSGNTNNSVTTDLNASWFYDWGSNDFSAPTREFVPMSWNGNGTSDAAVNAIIARDSLNHYLAFNEPDHDGQANMDVAPSIPLYKKLLRAGHRMGSPACTESQYRVWLDSFTTVANQQSLTIDFVAIHWYDWGNWTSTFNANPSATDVFNRFKAHIANVYDLYKKPIWITEFNANPNRPSAIQVAFMQLALPWLDSDPRVERYAYFFGNDVPVYNSGTTTLSTSGSFYSSHASVNAYPENIYDTRPAFPITLAGWDPSTFTQGGLSVSNFAPTTLNTNMTAPSGLKRGSGAGLPYTTSSNGYWGGSDFSTTTADAGVDANKFFTFSLKSKNSKSVNYHSIDKFNIRINNIGPIQYQIDYQLDAGSFYPIATLSGPTRTTGNYILGPIDLSKIAGLQDVPTTSTITFRITPFDASSTGTFLIGSGTADTDADMLITGGYSDANIITTPLPVKLSEFKLNRNDNNVLLNWKTQLEINFSHFEIERSGDGSSFNALASMVGSNSSNGRNYSYTDVLNTSAGKFYYRLKMVDKDGSFTYSNILAVDNNTFAKSFLVYPTIANGSTIRASFKNVSVNAQLKVLNINGQLVSMYNLTEGANTKSVETTNLSKGVYFLLLQDKGSVQTTKFIKQ